MKALQSFNSYRKFLTERFNEEKEQQSQVTLRSFGKKLSLTASMFKMVLDGQRNLTISNIHFIARALKLTRPETEYFEALVHYEQAKDAPVKSFYRGRLATITKENPVSRISTQNRKLISAPLVPSFLVYLLDVVGVRKDSLLNPHELKLAASRFSISEGYAQQLFELCMNAIVFEAGDDRAYHIRYDKIGSQLNEKDYFLSELEAASQEAKSKFAQPESFFRAFTLTITQEDLPKLRHDLLALAETYMAKNIQSEDRVIEKIVIAAYPAVTIASTY